MYNAHWIHSLPYSKFIELTLIKFKNNILFRTLQTIKCPRAFLYVEIMLSFYDILMAFRKK